jgi:hypothetical protein
MDSIKKLKNLNQVRGLSLKKYELEKLYDACMQDKHVKSSFKVKEMISTSTPL